MLHPLPLANLGSMFGIDGIVVLVLGLLIFGRKLPEVGKNLGKTIVEFKKGLNGGYSDEKDKDKIATDDEPAEVPTTRRLSSGSNRIAATPVRSRRVAESEEV